MSAIDEFGPIVALVLIMFIIGILVGSKSRNVYSDDIAIAQKVCIAANSELQSIQVDGDFICTSKLESTVSYHRKPE